MEDNRKQNKGKRGVLWAIMALAACGMAAALFVLIKGGVDSKQQQAQAEELREQVVSETTPAPQPEAAPDVAEQPEEPVPAEPAEWWEAYAVQPDKAIDFAALSEINEDVRAWISLPGTDIDYPVLYDEKYRGHYLGYDFENNRDKAGAIFFDDFNSDDFSDRVTVIYGHNMKNGSMFAQLHNLEDAAFFDACPVFRIYTPDYTLEYEIIAANEASDDHILALNDFTDDEVYQEYLESIYDVRDMSANFREAELTVEDRIVILATCVSGDDDARYLVHGRLKAIG